MFNVPWKLQKNQKFVTPKGPNFTFGRSFEVEVNDCSVTFNAPKHRPSYYLNKPINNDKNIRFKNNYNQNRIEEGHSDHWREAEYFYHAWAFYGPWFTGALSELKMAFNFKKIVKYPASLSLFHPRAFEQVACDYLTYTYGHHLDFTRDFIQEFNAPVDWTPLKHLSVHGAYLKVVSQDFSPHRTIEHWVFFPLADDLLGVMHFFPTRFLNLPREELDKLVNEQPMLDLMEQIINSLKVTLSPQAQAQQAAAIEGLEDPSLVDTHPILDWSRKSNNEDKSENLRLAILG